MKPSENNAESRDKKKRTIQNIKYLCAGVIVGAILSPVILFSSGNSTTTANADRLARESANKAEALAILPYCVANFHNSAKVTENTAALQKANHWERGEFIMKGGWADAPDGTGRGSQVANACADALLAEVKDRVAEKSK
jgi:hypothetical protein